MTHFIILKVAAWSVLALFGLCSGAIVIDIYNSSRVYNSLRKGV